MLKIICLCLFITGTSSFLNIGRSNLVSSFSVRNQRITTVSEDAPWVIDEDSAEVNCESSASILRRKQAEAEAAKRALEEQLRKQEEERRAKEAADAAAAKATIVIEPSETLNESKAVSVQVASKPIQSDLASKEDQGFNMGLMALFPFIVGGLALFLLFPLYATQLAGKIP